MEELKQATADSSSAGEVPAEGARRFAMPKLSKRTLIIAGLVVLSLVIAVTAVMLYRSSAQKKQAAAELARHKAEQVAKAQEEGAAKAAELKRAHQEIMEGSTPLPVPQRAGSGAAAISATDVAAAVSEAAVVPADARAEAPAALSPELARPASAVPAASPVRPSAATKATTSAETASSPRKAESAVKAPDAAGGCAVSGQGAADYGKALAKCLEEFNRLEGRSPPARQETQK